MHRLAADFLAPAVRTAQGWIDGACLRIEGEMFAEVGTDGTGARLPGPVVPAIPNLHSHAFQRAIAGATEVLSPSGGDFWTCPQAMYGSLGVLTPDDVVRPKPDPESLLLACEKLQCSVSDTIFIGDHRRDIDAGIASGCQTIAASYGYLADGESAQDWGADAIAASSLELRTLIEDLLV